MPPLFKTSLFYAIAAALASLPVNAAVAEGETPDLSGTSEAILPTVKVRDSKLTHTEDSRSYTVDSTTTATGLNLSLRDTPQSVTVITRERMNDQAITTVYDALRNTTGISVKAADRGRSSVSARGFEVDKFQFDGLPTALYDDININTAMFDSIEVVRGATGLLTGAGDPSAAVNLVRKHANSKTFSGFVSIEAGSWDHRAGTLDVTTPLNESGSVRGRVVANLSEQDSFIDLEETKNTLLYGIVDMDLSAHTRLSIGASTQNDERDGVLWAGLPYWYSDGSRTDWRRSKTTAADWNQWDVKTESVFATLEHTFQNRWKVRASVHRIETDDEEKMLWLRGNPDRNTGLGMEAYPYHYIGNPEQTNIDAMASGPFMLWGRQQEASVGLMRSKLIDRWSNRNAVSPAASFPVGDFNAWDGSFAEPALGPRYDASETTTTQSAIYAVTRLQVTDPLKLILGARLSNWKLEDDAAAWTPEAYSYDHDNVVTPYVGAVYDITAQTSAYASYTSIFNPQKKREQDGSYLDPLEGNSYELGLKSEWMNGLLNTTAAVFHTKEDNFAIANGFVISKPTEIAYRAGEGITVRGYELEATGEIQPNWSISAGWTHYSAKDADDNDVAVDHPRKLLKLFTKYKLTGNWQALSIGGGINWEGEQPARAANPATGEEEKIGQAAYALVDLMAKYQFDNALSLQANIYNVFDKQYVTRNTGWWGGPYTYGEPRRLAVSLNYTF